MGRRWYQVTSVDGETIVLSQRWEKSRSKSQFEEKERRKLAESLDL